MAGNVSRRPIRVPSDGWIGLERNVSFVIATISMNDGLPSFEGVSHAAFGLSVPDGDGEEAGIFAHWEWDGETFEVCNDRHGYVPLYYHLDDRDGSLTVSDSPLAIIAAGVSVKLDMESLGFFCRAGFLVGDRTLLAGILRIPPGATLRWNRGRLRIDLPSDRFTLHAPRDLEEASIGWKDRFQEAMRRRQPEGADFAIPLSGGRDSRMMLMELRALGHHPTEVVSFGPVGGAENEDLSIARMIARRLDLPHAVARTTTGWLDTERERHAWCGCECLEHAWMAGCGRICVIVTSAGTTDSESAR